LEDDTTKEPILPYDRSTQWDHFSEQVARHITDYILIQYGNPAGNEQVDTFTIEDCYRNIERYMNRRHANIRGDKERLRDVIKIAHYASFIYDKLRQELGEPDVY